MSNDRPQKGGNLSRRDFICNSALTALCVSFGSLASGCGDDAQNATQVNQNGTQIRSYPISSDVQTTLQRTITFPAPGQITGLTPVELCKVADYGNYDYGKWSYGPPLLSVPRNDIMANGYVYPSGTGKQLLNFFTISDIHITDKETPLQLIYLQQSTDPMGQAETSIYSPVMLYTTHVLDAAIQTVNALHKTKPFNFGLSLGDCSNSTQYNELRWYIDVIDGKVITPSSGAHLGCNTIDYQMPFQAAGLNKEISFYQVIGNHDKFCIGSFDVYNFPNPNLNLPGVYTGSTVFACGDVFSTTGGTLNLMTPTYYMGVLDGSTPYGTIINSGLATSYTSPPTVVADANRRSLTNSEWIKEFFNTTSSPVGHGFNLVDPTQEPGFACYSFVPDPAVPLKIIALDDNQALADGSYDIHGHGFLDDARWKWLRQELADGDAAGQLMIIAAHIPIGVSALHSETEWWDTSVDPYKQISAPTIQNATDLYGLVTELQSHSNFLMWISGHRHTNTVKAFPGPTPQQGFWQVETSSLRDWPQIFRTFEIVLNSDYTISIITTEVDPAVADGTPAATSRKYAIATQQIVNTKGIYQTPSQLIDLITQQAVPNTPDPYIAEMPTGMYNAQLYKQLSPAMVTKLQGLFPTI